MVTSFLASEEAMSSEYWIERGENWAEWLVSHSGWIQGPGNRAIGQTGRRIETTLGKPAPCP